MQRGAGNAAAAPDHECVTAGKRMGALLKPSQSPFASLYAHVDTVPAGRCGSEASRKEDGSSAVRYQ